jgi:thiopeptide-type bacteriocin biosynthesis protein
LASRESSVVPVITLRRFLVRAPLLRVAALEDPAAALRADPIGRDALSLAGARAGDAKVVARYGRRAAFRPTPRGLWAGVSAGEIGPRTRVKSGDPSAAYTVSWARLASLARALVDDPAIRDTTRVRVTPSLIVRGDTVAWIAGAAAAGTSAVDDGWREDAITDPIRIAIEWARDWILWTDLAAKLGDHDLAAFVDAGLLVTDLTPPLVGPPPLGWMIERITDHDVAMSLGAIEDALAREAPADALEILATLPGEAADPIHATLIHHGRYVLSEGAVARAASIAPLLFRLQHALASPIAERELDPSIAACVDTATEIFGAGALDLAAFALGDYGARPGSIDRAPAPSPPTSIVAYLIDRVVAAAKGESIELSIELSVDALDAILPPAAPPTTFELQLVPCREPRGAPPGTDWLLGLHAPAGSTWGRFAHAAGAGLAAALADLRDAERALLPDQQRVDVSFTPSADLADLATHPPLRDATLALTAWPDATTRAVTISDLELVATSSPVALRRGDGGRAITPSPLTRIRSTTAPPGVPQLVVGWSLVRQHAPWALAAPLLAALDRVPRITIDGFVVCPASWRIPDGVLAACRAGDLRAARAAIRRWRRDANVPRHIQIGFEDELLFVDLESPSAPEDLLLGPTVHEVWPPLDRLVDESGRRVEAIVAAIAPPTPTPAPAPATAPANANANANANAPRVPPPDRAAPPPDWRTFKLYGDASRHDRVLVGAIAPAIRSALRAKEIEAWFFLRYVDPPRRDHLRLRVRSRPRAKLDAFARRLDAALAPARATCDVVTVETAPYHPEHARYGGPPEAVFQADSERAVALLEEMIEYEHEYDHVHVHDAVDAAVRAMDALAASFGLEPPARHAVAADRRRAGGDPPDASTEARRRVRRLAPLLAATPTSRAPDRLDPAIALPPLLHLAINRVAGVDPRVEQLAYFVWERALASAIARLKDSR